MPATSVTSRITRAPSSRAFAVDERVRHAVGAGSLFEVPIEERGVESLGFAEILRRELGVHEGIGHGASGECLRSQRK